MKKIVFLSLTAMVFCGCSHDFSNYNAPIDVSSLQDKDPNAVTQEDIQANVASIFGTIDPNQDWNLLHSGSIMITADAPLTNIVKVQILTESPFFNPEAKVISEADVTNGETVTLTYDAPNGNDEIIAACLDSEGNYYIKPFETGTTNLSFGSSIKARTRAGDVNIDVNAIVLNSSNALKSIGAGRTIYANLAKETNDGDMKSFATSSHIDLWEGSNWEKEMLWQVSSIGNIGSSWSVENGTVVRNIEGGISADEKKELKSIFDSFLGRATKNNNKQDNLASIRNGAAVKFFNNQLVSDGVNPITLIPVQLASTEASSTDIYYYYYNPETAPTEKDDLANFIKNLPKFKAMHCGYTKDAASVDNLEFFKVHEYLLPYFGDGNLTKTVKCDTDGKLYRIKNGYKKDDKTPYSYLTYLGDNTSGGNKMSYIYNDNDAKIANQLWQVFKYEGRTILYNIGSQKFLVGVGSYMQNKNKAWATVFTSSIDMAKFSAFYGDADNHLWFNKEKGEALGFNGNNNRVAVNKTKNDGKKIEWYFEEFDNTSKTFATKEELIIEDPVDQQSAVSAVIPKNYHVGFLVRKNLITNNPLTDDYTDPDLLKKTNSGCVYSFGELNTIINQFPNYSTAVNKYSMKLNDPRVATFNANCKTYLTFEDGTDCNFSDMIIEVTSGGEQINDVYDITYFSYTMCFEDSPIADYDMNDVVLNFVRQDPTHVKVSLLACGAYDELYLQGLNGDILKGSIEIHELFGVDTNTFVNTNNTQKDPIVEVFEIDENMRLSDYIMNISVLDKTKGCTITLAGKGTDPHAIVIPGDFQYPLEKTCINTAYPLFNNWAGNAEQDRFWFRNAIEQYIYKK